MDASEKVGILPGYVELTAWMIFWGGVVLAKTVFTVQVQVDFIKIGKRSIIFLVDRSSVIGPVQTSKFHETNLKH